MKLLSRLLVSFALRSKSPATCNHRHHLLPTTSISCRFFRKELRLKARKNKMGFEDTAEIVSKSSASMPLSSSYSQNIIIHCNHAGASPSPSSVTETVSKHMLLEQRVGGYRAASMASKDLEKVYDHISSLLHRSDDIPATHEIALVESATVGWTRLFYALALYKWKRSRGKKQIILISEAEYAANVVAACQWAKDWDWTVLPIPSSRRTDESCTGKVDLQKLKQMLDGQYRYPSSEGSNDLIRLDPSDIAMICITHIPTNSGIVNDVERIGQLVSKYNSLHHHEEHEELPQIFYLVDACQSVGQREICVDEMQCHGLVGTGRKYLRGPRGTGFLYSPLKIANHLMPHHADHNGVPVMAVPPASNGPLEDLLKMQPKPGAGRFEFWESNLASKLGLGEAIRLAIEDIGMSKIQATTIAMAESLYQRLQAMDHIHLHHPSESGIVTFHVHNIPSATLKQRLWEGSPNIETSLVPATSTPLDSAQTGVPDLLRIALSYTNTPQDINAIVEKLQKIIASCG